MIEKTAKYVYSLLLDRKYKELEILTNGTRMNANEIEESIDEYGYQLIPYPEIIELDVI